MDTHTNDSSYKDSSRLITVIGAFLLLAGMAIGFLAPLEMYCFYLFSEGGRFYYEGFRFGSFMFGNIAAQVTIYYLLAAVLIPLGYGHLRKRRWIRPLSLALLWFWLVIGAPMIVVIFFVLAASKDISLFTGLVALVLLGLSYLVLPGLLIRFYGGQNVRRTLAARDTRSYWIENLPVPILVVSCVYLFCIVVLHTLILFNGIFPVFGLFWFGLPGIVLLDIAMAGLAGLTWGTLRQRQWAWWAGVILLGLFTASTILTLVRSDYLALLAGLAFPPREIEFLDGIPAQGYHFAIMAGLPLLLTWAIALLSKRHFRQVGL